MATALLAPQPTAVDAPPRCGRCGSQNLKREGFYRSKVFEEEEKPRQIVRCGDCNRYTYLAAGAVLPTKHRASGERLRRQIALRTAVYEVTKDVTDMRPNCPRCGGNKIHRHRKLDSGKRCYECRDCRRSFVAEDSAAFIDHRRVSRFESDDPQEEAIALLTLTVQNGGDFEETRELIMVSDIEKRVLHYFVSVGLFRPELVEAALRFRASVLRAYDELALQAAPQEGNT